MKQAIAPAGFFVLRTPLLPYDDIDWHDDLQGSRVGGQALDRALDGDRDQLRRCMRALLARPEVGEAISLASPQLAATIAIWSDDPDSDRAPGIEQALARYLVRAASRATPFGSFAGISVGSTGRHTRLDLPPRARYRRHTRLDMSSLAAVASSTPLLITGQEPIEALASAWSASPATEPAAKTLRMVADALGDLDAGGLGAAPEQYREVARPLEALGGPGELPRFHVDVVKPAAELSLGTLVLGELESAVDVLHRLARCPPPGDLDRFREAFVQRYGDGEVPLLEVVDHDAGIGFGPGAPAAAVLDGLPLPGPPRPDTDGPVSGELLDLLLDTAARREKEVVLTKDHIAHLADGHRALPLPGAFSVLASIEAESAEAIDAGRFSLLVRAVGGPSGAWLLGRFCHADPTLRQHVERHLRAEEEADPDALWAEVVYRPEPPFDNVVVRPVLRPYEIPCDGSSGAPPDRLIPLSDLLVSVRDGEVVLRSRRLGRRVRPRMTTAHDFRRPGPAAYRLLASLQVQGVQAGLSWSWGALGQAGFLPRVRHGRVVLALAQWRLDPGDLAELSSTAGSALLRGLRTWRRDREIPRLASVVDGDATLVVDFENVLAAEMFMKLARGRTEVVLQEVFPDPDLLCARGPEGRFVSEIVVPFTAPSPPAAPVRAAPAPSAPRRFPPGSEWVSAKAYAGPSAVEVLLREVVDPLRQQLFEAGEADRWFFVRYGDPHWHLRVRFHTAPGADEKGLADRVTQALRQAVDNGLAWRLQLDTYDREVERYGGDRGVAEAEELFTADSDAVLAALALLGPDADAEPERWQLALRSVDQLLDALGLGAQAKFEVLLRGRAIYAFEHGVDGELEKQLSRRYRARRPVVEALLAEGADPPGALGACFHALLQRSARIEPIGTRLRELRREGALTDDIGELATSYVHLHLNRLLASDHRAQELVIYDTLVRAHRSRLARAPAAGRAGGHG